MSRVRVLHPSSPQTFIFYKGEWTVLEAKSWLRRHGFKHADVDRKKNTYRFRQFDPSMCLRSTYGTKTWISGHDAAGRTRKGKKILAVMCRRPRRAALTTRRRRAA